MIARLRLDLDLVWSSMRNGGGPRAVMIALCTSLVSGLLMVSLTVVLFATQSETVRQQAQVSNLVSDDGVRGGYIFALLLICLAPLSLLRQVIRLGTATREKQLAALRLAGATTSDVRRLGALEVGLPALAGGLLGYLVFGALGVVFGGALDTGSSMAAADVSRELRLVPTSYDPDWWMLLLIALAVALLGALAGATASRSLLISPLGVSRRAPRSAPRPWGLLLVALAIALVSVAMNVTAADDLIIVGSLGALVLGLLSLAPWVAYRVGRIVAARATTVPVLIAGRRLAVDARPAGRAAAAVGAIAVFAGGVGALLADLPGSTPGDWLSGVDAYYVVPILLTAVVLAFALLLVVFAMAVHGVETLMDHSRSMASLGVLGLDREELEKTQRWEIGLVAIPMAVIGVLLGSVPLTGLVGSANRDDGISLLVNAATVASVWLAVRVSTRITRPWLVRATAPVNLRTP